MILPNNSISAWKLIFDTNGKSKEFLNIKKIPIL